MNEKDMVIIGGGPGGYVAAIHAADAYLLATTKTGHHTLGTE